MDEEIPGKISAEVILRSKSGRSLVHPDVPISAETIEEFVPAAETVAKAVQCLQELGFTVAQSGVALTIVGRRVKFEEIFKVQLTLKVDEKTGSKVVRPEGELVIPDVLKDTVEAVVFPEPSEFFS